MLTLQETRARDDVEAFRAAHAEPPTLDDAPGLVVAGAWAAIFLVLFGAVVAGLAVAAATAVGLILWRCRAPRHPAVRDPGRDPAS
jgi:hypothetical protein